MLTMLSSLDLDTVFHLDSSDSLGFDSSRLVLNLKGGLDYSSARSAMDLMGILDITGLLYKNIEWFPFCLLFLSSRRP